MIRQVRRRGELARTKWPLVFSEGGKYRIRKTAEGDRLLIDDEFLLTDGSEWAWSPGFYAGQVRAELLGPDDRMRSTYLLDVSPHPEKLGRDMFQAMLERIWAFDPGLVLGTEPAAMPIGHEAATAEPWLEYARLRAYGDRFVRALSAIAHRPLRELRAERAHLPLLQVRRADRQTALAALGNPQLLKVLRLWRRRRDTDRRAATLRRACRPGNARRRCQPLHCRHCVRGIPPCGPAQG